MNPAKRRRIDVDASALSKPFRSPLKLTPSVQPALSNDRKDKTNQQTDTTSTTAPPSDTSTSPADRSNESKPDDVVALQKVYAALDQQIRKLRQDVDAAEQAVKIRSTGQEDKLNKLIFRWRSIARDAADEVFVVANSRVKDMGGLKAWQKQSSQDQFDDWYGVGRGTTSSDAVDAFAESDRQPEDLLQDREGWHVKDHDNDHGDDDDDIHQSFTMGVMLRHFNIDPDLLDLDEAVGQWRD